MPVLSVRHPQRDHQDDGERADAVAAELPADREHDDQQQKAAGHRQRAHLHHADAEQPEQSRLH